MSLIQNKNVENIIEDDMMEYAVDILSDRCLPDIRDGLKPVYRRILWTMFKIKAFNLMKSANISGQVQAYHPHGSCYGTMVGMAQKDNQLHPFLIGKGNFGQYTSRDLQFAADRYTEVKLSDISIDMMKNFEKNIVDFIPNYDGTLTMPEVLPVKYPSILTIAQEGIGVGFASKLASFNLIEVCDASINYLETKKHTVLIPDFATGGKIINNKEVFEQINKSGSGTISLKAKAKIVDNKILITEIPYSTTREAIIDNIIELAKTTKLKEVIKINDSTGIKGLLISITARPGSDMNMLLEKLYRFTPLQSTYSCNMNILVDNYPKVLGVHQIIEKWISWRRECIKRGLTYDTQNLIRKLHILRGFEKVLVDIDKTIEIIRFSEESMIEKNLQDMFNIDFDQAYEVSNMKLRNINKDYMIKRIKDIEQLEKDIELNNKILENKELQNKIIIQGLKETKDKYGIERKTEIIEQSEITRIVIPKEEVQNYPVWIHLTKEGYCYKFRGSQQPTLKPGDEILKSFETNNISQILIFDKNRICYKLSISRVEETRVTNIGIYLPNLLRLTEIDIVSYSILDSKFKYLIIAYTNNRVVKVNLQSFEPGKNILKNAFNRSQDLVDILTLEDDKKLKIITDKTQIEIDTNNLIATNSRGATGNYQTRKGIMQKIEVI